MNSQPAQPIPGNGQHPDQQCYHKLDCPDQAMTAINAAQLADIAELLELLDGFLRRADGIADRLADYLHATGRDHPNPRAGPATTPTCSSTRSASPPTPSAPTANNRYSKHPSPVSSFTEQD